MRTNIEIDDELLEAAREATGQKTKRAIVEEALKLAVQLHRQKQIRELYGKVPWEGDLEQSRLGPDHL